MTTSKTERAAVQPNTQAVTSRRLDEIELKRQTIYELVSRLRTRAQIRRQIPVRKSVQEGKPDRLADLLDEAATMLLSLAPFSETGKQVGDIPNGTFFQRWGMEGTWLKRRDSDRCGYIWCHKVDNEATTELLHCQEAVKPVGRPLTAHHCQNGTVDVCLAANFSRLGTVCPHGSCDIDDSVRCEHLKNYEQDNESQIGRGAEASTSVDGNELDGTEAASIRLPTSDTKGDTGWS